MEKFRGRYRVESARLQGWDYRAAGWYFVTVCTKDRVPFFGDVINGEMVLSPIGRIVAEEWQRTPEIRSNVVLDEWVIMPNHLHGILVIVDTPDAVVETPRRGRDALPGRLYGGNASTGTGGRLVAGSVGAIIGQVKSVCTKRIRAAGHSDFAWQGRFHDHIIRNDESLQRIRAYIVSNPAKWTEDQYYVA